jgi:hypothetical protein
MKNRNNKSICGSRRRCVNLNDMGDDGDDGDDDSFVNSDIYAESADGNTSTTVLPDMLLHWHPKRKLSSTVKS